MKSMIRLLAALLLCLFALPALADTEGYYDYYIDDFLGGAVLTGYSGSETEVIVPEGYEVIGERAFAGCADMHRIELPASVTLIAEDAFDGCSPELIVAAPAGSYAESYAIAHGFAAKHE